LAFADASKKRGRERGGGKKAVPGRRGCGGKGRRSLSKLSQGRVRAIIAQEKLKP